MQEGLFVCVLDKLALLEEVGVGLFELVTEAEDDPDEVTETVLVWEFEGLAVALVETVTLGLTEELVVDVLDWLTERVSVFDGEVD